MSLAAISRRRTTLRKTFPQRPDHLSPALRQHIGDAIDALLAVLDAADGDADLEPDADLEDGNDQDESEEHHVA